MVDSVYVEVALWAADLFASALSNHMVVDRHRLRNLASTFERAFVDSRQVFDAISLVVFFLLTV